MSNDEIKELMSIQNSIDFLNPSKSQEKIKMLNKKNIEMKKINEKLEHQIKDILTKLTKLQKQTEINQQKQNSEFQKQIEQIRQNQNNETKTIKLTISYWNKTILLKMDPVLFGQDFFKEEKINK